MTRALRVRQTYDHRLRDAIAATGNADLFRNVASPASTRRTWAHGEVRVWSKYSNAQRISSLHLSKRLFESAIAVGYVFQFSGRSRDGLEDHAELHLRIRG